MKDNPKDETIKKEEEASETIPKEKNNSLNQEESKNDKYKNVDETVTKEEKIEITETIALNSKNDTLKIDPGDNINIFVPIYTQILQGNSSTPITNRPLYLFDAIEGFSLNESSNHTPFRILNEIPRFFEFSVMKNANQNMNPLSTVLFNEIMTIDQVQKSGEIFNSSTMTVRIKLRDSINGVDIGDVNVLREGNLKVKEVVSAYETSQPYASLLENRLMMLLKLYQATDMVLYKIPKKIVINSMLDGSQLHRNLSSMSFFEGDYPSIILSIFLSPTSWFVTAMENLYETAPIILGESHIELWQSKKMTSEISCITDQFASAIANLNFYRLQTSKSTASDYVNRCLANMFERDDIRIVSSVEDNITSLLYEPSRIEWTLIMYLIIIDRKVRDALYARTLEYISTSNRFTVYSFESIWDPKNGPKSQLSHQMFNTFLLRMAVGNTSSPYELIMLETFSSLFRINLNFPSLPSDFSAIIEIMALLFFVVVCPAIAQQTIDQWGYRLRKLLSSYLPTYQNQWETAYGVIRNGSQSHGEYTSRLTRSLSQQGWMYSIFSDVAKVNTVKDNYYALIKQIRAICIPDSIEIVLNRKRSAGYPYYLDAYTAYASLPQYDEGELNVDGDTAWVKKLYTIVDVVRDLVDLKVKKGADMSLPKADKTWVNTFFDYIQSLLSTTASPFQGTMRRMQNTLMNSFPFVIQRYSPVSPFNIPQDLILSPSSLETTQSGIQLNYSSVNQFDPFAPMRLLLTLEGDFKRNISVATSGVPQSDETLPQPQQNSLMLQGHILDNCALSLLPQARHFGLSMQLLRWILDPDEPTNPIKPIAIGIKHLLKLSNWAVLGRQIFSQFGLSFDDLFSTTLGSVPGIRDGRGITLQLRELDPETQRPSKIELDGSIFGKQIQYTDRYMSEHLQILSQILLGSKSPILNLVEGCYIGRFLVDELSPQQLDIESGWKVIKMFDKDKTQISFQSSPSKAGYAYSLTITVGTNSETYFLPYDRRFPNIMIEIDRLSRIPLSHKEVVAQAIVYGNLALKVTKAKIAVNLTDLPSRTENYSEDKTSSEIERIISVPDGDIISYAAATTIYATNYTLNAKTIPTYVQWMSFMEPVDKNLHAAVLNSGLNKSDITKLPSKYEIEYGTPGGSISRLFSDGINKLTSNVINWNNSFKAIGDGLIASTPQLEYIPSQPMDYSYFTT